jgi:DeoR/GlpR family transcriptional regulator of sugar metabolism
MLLESGQIDIQTLIRGLPVSASTLRRDLARLEAEGFIVKHHGGVSVNPGLDMGRIQGSLDPALGMKRVVGAFAADLVVDNDVIFIGGGTTCLSLALNLKNRTGLTVITNGFDVATELCMVHGTKVIFMGGDVTIEDNKAFTIGNIASIVTEDLFVQKCFITVNGVSLEHGYSINNHLLMQMYTTLLNLSNNVIVLADGNKFEHRAFKKLCDFSRIKRLVTDRSPDKSFCSYASQYGITIQYPKD